MNEALSDLEGSHYVSCSKYYMQLELYRNYYDDQNILIVSSEELRNERQETLREVFRFLGVDASFFCEEFSELHHKSGDKRKRTALEYRIVGTKWAALIRMLTPSVLLQGIRRMTEKSIEIPELDNQVKEQLIDLLEEDVDSMRKYTGQAFSHWCL